MGDIPILTTGTSEVTAPCSQRQPRTTGIEMKKGLFLNGRNHGAGDLGINKGVESSLVVKSGITIPKLLRFDPTPSLTDIASNAAIRKRVI
jgi:hypothetical protein